MNPADLRYTSEHEWVSVEDGVATVGITDYAQQELGDIVFVDLPEAGRTVSAGEEFATVESVKAVAEVYAPAGGEVTEVNESLNERPEAVNQDPYGNGWMVRLRLVSPAELEGTMDAQAYAAFCEKGDS
jgi:glycine cleavage system H protein